MLSQMNPSSGPSEQPSEQQKTPAGCDYSRTSHEECHVDGVESFVKLPETQIEHPNLMESLFAQAWQTAPRWSHQASSLAPSQPLLDSCMSVTDWKLLKTVLQIPVSPNIDEQATPPLSRLRYAGVNRLFFLIRHLYLNITEWWCVVRCGSEKRPH